MKKISAQRLQVLMKRQGADKYGENYQPCIRATPKEAPRTSRPSILRSRLLGREIHVLSEPERWAALLAMYHPRLFDLHEQRMLSTTPRPHPLAAHPRAAGMDLPHLRGTVQVADELGFLDHHARVKWTPQDAEESVWLPYPYIGDLLLYLSDEQGPYCVNWTVKTVEDEFERPKERMRLSRNPIKAEACSRVRLAIEVEYYNDAEIQTVRVTEDKIDATLSANLDRAFGWNQRSVGMNSKQYRRLVERFNDALYLKIAPIDVIVRERQRYGYERDDCIAVLNQAIWRRLLRVDLFKPILYDHPLRQERIDLVDRYSEWFQRMT